MPRIESEGSGRGRRDRRRERQSKKQGANATTRPSPSPPSSAPINSLNATSSTRIADDSDHTLLPVELYSFINGSQWLPISSSPLPLPPAALPHHLKLLTYNIWSTSPSHSPHQTTSVLAQINHTQADIIALQEVSLSFWTALNGDKKIRAHYVLAGGAEDFLRMAGEGDGGWGKEGDKEAVGLLVRRNLVGRGSRAGVKRLEVAKGEGGKGVMMAELWRDGIPWLRVATSHFSSLPINATLRQGQYRAAISLLSTPSVALPISTSAPALMIMGDFNNSSHAELKSFEEDNFNDCFDLIAPRPTTSTSTSLSFRPKLGRFSAQSHPSASFPNPLSFEETHFRHSPTFGTLYPFVPNAPRSRPRKPRRIDRILIKQGTPSASIFPSAVPKLRCVRYEMMGERKVRDEKGRLMLDRERGGRDGLMWASDHLGVLVTVQVDCD